MSHRKYALELLQSLKVLDLKPCHIPIDPLIKLNDTDGDPFTDPSTYRAIVGKLLYLTITRLDLSYAAHALSQFSHNSITPHSKALIKVLRYIKLCPTQGLFIPTNTTFQLQAFCDSNWANCTTTRRSIIVFYIFLDSSLISWQSKKQIVVSRSSTEFEYRALADCTCEVTWHPSLLQDMQIKTTTVIPIYYDNQSSIPLAYNPVQHARPKHIESDCRFFREKIKNGTILPTFIPSSRQVADALTHISFSQLKSVESISQNLCACSMARDLCRKIATWWGVSFSKFSPYEEWPEWLLNHQIHSDQREVLEGVFYMLWWFVWSFRNKSLFGTSILFKAVIFDDLGYVWRHVAVAGAVSRSKSSKQ
ncbi:uncharacterized mitochondrial protein-like protein [Tanacetum coccineum]